MMKTDILTAKKILFAAVRYILLLVFAIFFIFPYFYMLTRSLMSLSEVNSPDFILFPSKLHFENYKIVADYLPFLKNTLLIIVINGFFIPVTGAMIAFPFARYRFKGMNIMFSCLMATVMLPGSVTTIPLYVLYSKLGLLDTLASQWVGAFFGGSAVQIFLIVQFMRGIPDQLGEAAKIDGANKFRIYWQIVMPLCLPIIAFTMVNTFLGTWNDFMNPLLYLGSRERLYTISLGLYMDFMMSGANNPLANVQMAGGIIMLIPCAVLFFCFQKLLIEGVTLSGIKG